jgi:hypothetical protein
MTAAVNVLNDPIGRHSRRFMTAKRVCACETRGIKHPSQFNNFKIGTWCMTQKFQKKK